MDDERLADLLESDASIVGSDADLTAAREALALLDRVWPTPCAPRPPDSKSSTDMIGSLFSLPGFGAPQRLGRFQIVRELGRGGGGLVFLAADPMLGRDVALKIPRPEVLASRSLSERFLREGRLLATLNHPNIVPILEAGMDGPVGYLASPYFPAGDLKSWLKASESKVEPVAAARCIGQLAAAMQCAHDRGIYHRDLKPSNVLLERIDGLPLALGLGLRPRIADFGLAKQDADAVGLTTTNAVLGTPAYMAPEQASGRSGEAGPCSDIYSLGAILFELLTGVPPFRGSSEFELLQQVESVEPPTCRSIRRDVPFDLETICLKCLEKEPRRRYRTATLLSDDIEAFLAGRPIAARPLRTREKAFRWIRREPLFAAVAVCAFLAVCMLAAFGAIYAINVHGLNRSLAASLTNAERLKAESEARRLLAMRGLYAYDIPQADQAIREGDFDEANARLSAHAESKDGTDCRGFEWRYLRAQADRLSRTERVVAVAGGRRMVVSRDGRFLAVASQRPFAVVEYFRINDSRLVWSWRSAKGEPFGLAISPDGRKVAVTHGSFKEGSGELTILDADLGRPMASTREPSFLLGSANFIDCNRIAMGTFRSDHEGDLRIWNMADGTTTLLCGEHSIPPHPSAVTRGGDRILAGALDRFTTVRTNQLGWERTRVEGTMIFGVAVSPTGTLAATCGSSRLVQLWSIATGERAGELRGYESDTTDVDFSPCGQKIAACDRKEARIWDVRTRQCIATRRLHGAPSQIRFSSDGKSVFILVDEAIERWHLKRKVDRRGDLALGEQIWSLAFSPCGDILAVGHDNQHGMPAVELHEVESRQCVKRLQGHSATVVALKFSADGRRLHSGALDGNANVWDVKTGANCLAVSGLGTKSPRALDVSPDGALLAVAGSNGSIRIVDASQGGKVAEFSGHAGRRATGLVFFSDGQTIATTGFDGKVARWTAAGVRANDAILPADGEGSCIALSGDGQTLAVGDNRGVVHFFDADSLALRASVSGHKGRVCALTFATDDKSLASAGMDGLIRLWQPATGRAVLTLRGHKAQVNALAFHPNGCLLASGDHLGVVRFWDGSSIDATAPWLEYEGTSQ